MFDQYFWKLLVSQGNYLSWGIPGKQSEKPICNALCYCFKKLVGGGLFVFFFKWLLKEIWKNRALRTVKYRSQQIMTNFKSVLNCDKQCITLASTRIHRLLLYSNRAFVKLCYCISLLKLHTGISFYLLSYLTKQNWNSPFPTVLPEISED